MGNAASCQILDTWHNMLNIVLNSPREVTAHLRETWERQIADRGSASIVKEAVRGDESVTDKIGDCGSHCELSDSVRKVGDRRTQAAIEDMSLMPKMELRPLIFEQRYAAKAVEGEVPQP